MNRKGVSAVLLLCLSMNLAAGCKDRTVDYDIGISTESTWKNGESGVEQFADILAWEDEWTTESTAGDAVTLKVDADISLPQTRQMSVVEVMEPVFDADYKETMAKRIFGSGEIYYNDIPHLPRKELEEKRSYYEMWYNAYAEPTEEYTSKIIYSSGGENVHQKEMEEKLKACEAAMADAKDTYTPVDIFTADAYLGNREGVPYELSFSEWDVDRSSLRRIKTIKLAPKDVYQICPDNLRETEELIYTAWPQKRNPVENQCRISEEEAQQMAQCFIDTLELDYSIYAYSQPMVWANNTLWDDWTANGYVFTFDFGVDGVSFVSFGREEDYINFFTNHNEEDELQYSLNAQMKVYVSDAGVIAMTADNPVETIQISESVELLSLDTIEGIMKDQLTKKLETFRFNYPLQGDLSFDDMQLIYFRVRDKKNAGSYSYVPAWRLSSASKEEEYHVMSVRNPVLINAMDGSVIDFYDET